MRKAVIIAAVSFLNDHAIGYSVEESTRARKLFGVAVMPTSVLGQ